MKMKKLAKLQVWWARKWRSSCTSLKIGEEGGWNWNWNSKRKRKRKRRWEKVEAESRDGKVVMTTEGYVGEKMDQRSSSMPINCDKACSVLSLTMASWILFSDHHHHMHASSSNSSSNSDDDDDDDDDSSHNSSSIDMIIMPSPRTLDTLLVKGSLFWSKFLSFPAVRALSQPDGLHEIDLVLRFAPSLFRFTGKSAAAAIAEAPHGSYTAFLRPAFEHSRWTTPPVAHVAAMAEAWSFDSLWPSLIGNRVQSKTFIVGWNAHYFVLHVPAASSSEEEEDSSIYLIDTLGSRLSPSCRTSYVLRFNSHTRLSFFSTSGSSSSSAGHGPQLTTTYRSSQDAFHAYFSHFLSSHTIREASRDFQNGLISQECLFHKLQVDFRQVVLSWSTPSTAT